MTTATKKRQPLPNQVEMDDIVPLEPEKMAEGMTDDEINEEADRGDETTDFELLARQVFGDMVAGPEAPPDGGGSERGPGVVGGDTRSFRPTHTQMWQDGSGGLYLPVRRRVVWMRGEPVPQPTWTIRTELLALEMGRYLGTKTISLRGRPQVVSNVEGGYAVVRATVQDQEGRVIAEDMAHERSESFFDFIEKASTAAIGRALALCGYGTEVALDLDEGYEDGNIADAPVQINIQPSAIEGVQQGGRQSKATQTQIQAIRDRARELSLTPTALAHVIRTTVPEVAEALDEVDDGPDGANQVLGVLSDLSFQACGQVVQVLLAATPETQ